MNLAIDIGNTNCKLALFENNELKEFFFDETAFEKLLSKNKIKHAIISKTANNTEIETKLHEKKITPVLLTADMPLPVKILYKTPQSLGADRIAGSVAAHFVFPNHPVLKVDFGTCITYDFINEKGEYPGGAISPGMMMRFKALHNYTAKLPLIDPMQLKNFELTGVDTETGIVSGVMNGIKEEVNGIINEYEARFANLKVVATGGDSGLFVTLLKSEIFARPYLVLEGLNRILNYHVANQL